MSFKPQTVATCVKTWGRQCLRYMGIRTKGRNMWNYIKLAVLGIAVVLFGLAANYGRDFGYQVHALIFMAAAVMTFIYTLRTTGDVKPQPTGYFDGVVRYGVVATAGWGVVGFLVGDVHCLSARVSAVEL